jgi:hypothetical protein
VSLDEAERESLRRSVPPRVEAAPLREAVRSVAAALRAFPDRGMIVGGIAALARGVARPTHDVQATLATTEDVAQVFGRLERFELYPRVDDAVAYAREHQELPLCHRPSGVAVDLALAWLPFELDALSAAEDLLLGSVEVTVARADDLVIYAALVFGPQERQDIERLVELHGRTMDLPRIRRVVADLARANDDDEREGELERLIARGLGLVK